MKTNIEKLQLNKDPIEKLINRLNPNMIYCPVFHYYADITNPKDYFFTNVKCNSCKKCIINETKQNRRIN